MGRVHELIFKINGKLDGSASSALKNLASDTSRTAKELKKLEKARLNIQGVEKAKSSIAGLKEALSKSAVTTKAAKAAYNASAAETRKLGEAAAKAKAKVSNLEMEVAKSVKPTRELKSALAVAKLEAKQAGQALKASADKTKTLGASYEKAKSGTIRLNSELKREQATLAGLKSKLTAAGVATSAFGTIQKKAGRMAALYGAQQAASAAYEKSKAQTSALAGSLTRKALLVGGTIGVPVKLAIDAENTMADIGKMIDFKDAVEKADFEAAMRKKLSTEIPMAFKDYGDLISSAAGAGIKKAELLPFSEDAAKMSVAMDIEAGAAGEMMAKWRSAFQMSQKDVVGLADKINYLSNNSAATAPEIANIVSKVGALGELSGFNAGQVAAIGTAMVSMGVDADVGATGMKKVATVLTKGAGATKRQQDAYAQLGLTAKDVASSMMTDAEGTFVGILEKIRALPKEAQTSVLTNLFGEESVQAIAPMLNNLDTLKQSFADVNEEAGKFKGSMQEEFDIRSKTTENQLKLLKQSMSNVGSQLGSALLPTIVELAKKASAAANKFSDWAAKNPQLVSTIVKIAAAIAAASLAATAIKLVISGITTGVFGAASGVLKMVEKFHTVCNIVKAVAMFIMGLNPIVLAIGVVVAIVAALVIRNWDKIKAFAIASYTAIKTGFNNAMQAIASFFGGIASGIQSKWSAIKSAGSRAASAISGAWHNALGWITGKINAIKGTWDKIKSGISNFGGGGRAPTGATPRATGGIVRKPELAYIGEGGDDEAVIPLNNRLNSMRLWQYAGERLGALQRVSAGGGPATTSAQSRSGSVVIQFNIDASGADPGTAGAIQAAMDHLSPRFERMVVQALNKYDHDRARLAFS